MAKLSINSNSLGAGITALEKRRQRERETETYTINPAKRREFAHHEPTGELAEEFICPPFSVLDGRAGWWLNRKRAWISLGLRGEEGRNAEAYNIGNKDDFDNKRQEKTMSGSICSDTYDRSSQSATGASVFDPVLTELCYRWFMPNAGGVILDPFAGGSTRGIVAAYLGYGYTGIEVRPGQVKANRKQAEQMGLNPKWILGDSANLKRYAKREYDLVFTSPPYYDLEVYSDQENDGSTFGTYEQFLDWYENVFGQAFERLRNNRFVAVQVGEIRRPDGAYYNFVGDTITIFNRLGLAYYNEIILLTPVGSLPVRTGSQFRGTRKVGKTHQNILVFWKGRLDAIPASICKPIKRKNKK